MELSNSSNGKKKNITKKKHSVNKQPKIKLTNKKKIKSSSKVLEDIHSDSDNKSLEDDVDDSDDYEYDILEDNDDCDSDDPKLQEDIENFLGKMKFDGFKESESKISKKKNTPNLKSSEKDPLDDTNLKISTKKKQFLVDPFSTSEKKKVKPKKTVNDKSIEKKDLLEEPSQGSSMKRKINLTDKRLQKKIKIDISETSKSTKIQNKEKQVNSKNQKKSSEQQKTNKPDKKKLNQIKQSSELKSQLSFDISELKSYLSSNGSSSELQDHIIEKKKSNKKVHVFSEAKRSPNISEPEKLITKPICKLSEGAKSTQATKNIQKKTTEVQDSDISEADAFKNKLKKHLQSASFRIINEQLYTSSGSDAYNMFENDPNAFKIYHAGFNTQVEQWPVNPVDVIVSWLKKKPRNWVVADFGCGEAILAKSINQHKVHSFDLVSSDPLVTQCDMAHTPLEAESVNVVVFCLSLMGTNLKDYILEANRILEYRGVLKVAEVESRFTNNGIDFLKVMLKLGFKVINKDQTNKYFWLFDFLKIKNVTLKDSTPEIDLKPCIYKKR